MNWFNPWGRAAELERELLQTRAAHQSEWRVASNLADDMLRVRADKADLERALRTAQSRIAYLEDRLSRAVFRDPKTGRLLPKGKLSL